MKKIIFLFLTFFILSNSYAAPARQIVFFGDSLTDNGNLYRISYHIIPKSPPYFEGRFTNGLTWAEHVAINYSLKYQIYAVGGATAVFHRPTSKFVAPTTLSLEVYKYILDSLFQDRSENLYVIWIGDNDYMFYQDTDPDTGTTRVVDGIISAINTLASYGAKHFLVLNLTDTARTPFIQANGDATILHNLIMIHNNKLQYALDQLQKEKSDLQLTTLDAYTFFNDVLDNPRKYNQLYHLNIQDTHNACWQGGLTLRGLQQVPDDFVSNSPELNYTYLLGKSLDEGNIPCDNANEHIFWDEMHPSSIMHMLFARAEIDALDRTKVIS